MSVECGKKEVSPGMILMETEMRYENIPLDKINPNRVGIFEVEEGAGTKLENIIQSAKCQLHMMHVHDNGDGTFISLMSDFVLGAYKNIGFSQVFCIIHDGMDTAQKIILHIQLCSLSFEQDVIERSKWLNFIEKTNEIDEMVRVLPYNHADMTDIINLLDFDWSTYESQKNMKKEMDTHSLF